MDDLPSEILCMIFQNLDYLDIFTCGLCCRRFYDVAKYINPFTNIDKIKKTIIEYSIKCNDIALFKKNLINASVILYDESDFYRGFNEELIKKHMMYYFKYDRDDLFYMILRTYDKIHYLMDLLLYCTDITIHCIETNNIKFYKVLLNMNDEHIHNFRFYYARVIIQTKNKAMLEFSINHLKSFYTMEHIMNSLILDTTPLTLNIKSRSIHIDDIYIKDAISKYIEVGYYEELCKKFDYNPQSN